MRLELQLAKMRAVHAGGVSSGRHFMIWTGFTLFVFVQTLLQSGLIYSLSIMVIVWPSLMLMFIEVVYFPWENHQVLAGSTWL